MSTWVKKDSKSVAQGNVITMDISTLGNWAFKKGNPSPGPETKTVSWNGDATGKTVVAIGDTLSIVKMSDDIPTTTQILGSTITVQLGTGSSVQFTTTSDKVIDWTEMLGSECYVVADRDSGYYGIWVVRQPGELEGGVQVPVGIWFAKYIGETVADNFHTSGLVYQY